jgi:hypothetical protein
VIVARDVCRVSGRNTTIAAALLYNRSAGGSFSWRTTIDRGGMNPSTLNQPFTNWTKSPDEPTYDILKTTSLFLQNTDVVFPGPCSISITSSTQGIIAIHSVATLVALSMSGGAVQQTGFYSFPWGFYTQNYGRNWFSTA